FPSGIYHLAAGGETSWHGYARHIIARARQAGQPLRVSPDRVIPIRSTDYPTQARRPHNSRLDTTRLREAFGLTLPDWREGLDHILQQIL
ncbi:MAG TPA: dTDP-4-dehydrorhamnose reductase, partial [Comamonadaceae bacterium]|nr:dTDP-4-dehydrorhamnose reductase [Comamonadaceae bacterium]